MAKMERRKPVGTAMVFEHCRCDELNTTLLRGMKLLLIRDYTGSQQRVGGPSYLCKLDPAHPDASCELSPGVTLGSIRFFVHASKLCHVYIEP